MEKVVIWGAGVVGRRVVDFFGSDKVDCIIDGDEEKQGTSYHGVNIVSFDDYLNHTEHPTIIISMMVVPNVIWDMIHSADGIKAYDLTDFPEYFYEMTPDKYMEFVYQNVCENNNKSCCFYERNPLSEIFEEKYGDNISVKYVKDGESGDEAFYCWNKKTKLDDSLRSRAQYIKDVDISMGAFYNERVAELKDKHKGQRIFIICNGPSLRWEDLDVLYQHNEICIGMNMIYKMFDSTKWRPDYYVATDPYEMRYYGDEKDAIPGIKIISDSEPDALEGKDLSDYRIIHGWFGSGKPRFSSDLARGFYSASTVAYVCLQLAVYLGCANIYLLGADCDNINQHFPTKDKVDAYEGIKAVFWEDDEDMLKKQTMFWVEGYQSAKDYSDEHGINIYNATRGGKLEVFERVEFDSIWE